MPFSSPYAEIDIPNQPLFDFLFDGLSDETRAGVALTDGPDGQKITYDDLIRYSEFFAGAIARRGVSLGDVVAIHLPNTPWFAVVFHGTLRSGATATTINALFNAADIAKQLTDSQAKMVVTVGALKDSAIEAARSVGLDDKAVVVIDGAEGFESLTDLLSEGNPAPEVHFDPETHLAVLPYSSGTTGAPKGVMLTHRNLVANVRQSSPHLDVNPGDSVLAVLPFFHIYGLTVLLNVVLYQRAQLVTMPRFDLAEFLRLVSQCRCTHVFIAPPIAVALAKHPSVDDVDLSAVRVVFSGAAALDSDLAQTVANRVGCKVRQGYGMSEMSPVSNLIPVGRDDISLNSVGPLVANMTAKIVKADTATEVDYPEAGSDELSEPGELWCAGPNIMVGYLNRDSSNDIDSDGFLHTGDVVRLDGHGNVYLVDRMKELIKYKGYQVPPAELESLLLSHPQIADSAVIGVLDTDGEEIPKAFVVLQNGVNLSADAVMSWLAERVSPHKKIRAVEFVESIPKSAAGKILRRQLR